jgi:hypothetical protein
VSTASDAERVAVEQLLLNASADELDIVYNQIMKADIEPVAGLPFYDLVWTRFGFSFAPNDAPPMAITHLVVL